jgi:hypothetical protein
VGSGAQIEFNASSPMLRIVGVLLASAYAALIVWLYAAQPRNVAEITGGLTAQVGAYRVDEEALADGLAFFRKDAFVESRAAFARADPAQRDARTQFYVAYSFYRQGWGRVYNDNQLFTQGLAAVDRAIAVAPDHRVIVDDPQLEMHSADGLRAELQRGLTRELSDFNPLKVFRRRK